MWMRDAPKSIGTKNDGLKRFQISDIEAFIGHLDPFEQMSTTDAVKTLAPTGFQIWGIPEGASGVLATMAGGDFLLLLESIDFAYVGQVIQRLSEPCWDLSRHIWGEQRFPLIILLQGQLISYPWEQFKEDFRLASNYEMRGQTAKLGPQRIPNSNFETEEAFIARLLTTTGISRVDQRNDFDAFANNLTVHLRLVKERANQERFRLDAAKVPPCPPMGCGAVFYDAAFSSTGLGFYPAFRFTVFLRSCPRPSFFARADRVAA